jgi:hypothetical protein
MFTMALVVTVGVLVMGRDVLRAARTESQVHDQADATFVALANAITQQENLVAAQWAHIIATPPPGRAGLYARLVSEVAQAQAVANQVVPLESVRGGSRVSAEFAHLVQARTVAFKSLADDVAAALGVPPPANLARPAPVAQAVATLQATSAQWATLVAVCEQDPRSAPLTYFVQPPAISRAGAVAALVQGGSATVQRAIALRAVAIAPVPFPSAHQRIEFVPVTSFSVTISVVNLAFSSQPVTVVGTLTYPSGRVETRSSAGVITPGGDLALAPLRFAVAPGDRAMLHIAISGGPIAAGTSGVRTYQVVVAPSV